MKNKLILFYTFLLLISCEQTEPLAPAAENTLRLPGANVLKLDKLIEESTTYIENNPIGFNKQILDYTYSCIRPYNRLIKRELLNIMDSDTINLIEKRFEYNDNFMIQQEMGYFQGNKLYNISYQYNPDGSWDGGNILQDASGNTILNRLKVENNLITEYESESPNGLFLYKYYYSRNNLKRRDLYINVEMAIATIKFSSFSQALKDHTLVSNVKILNRESYQTTLFNLIKKKIDILQTKQSKFREKTTIWIPIESAEYTYFEHLNPIATASIGWPATLSAEFVGTSINDPKSETRYALDENGNKIGLILDFRSELIGTLINKLPRKESFTFILNSFDPSTNTFVELTTKGTQEFIYQSGCMPFPIDKSSSN